MDNKFGLGSNLRNFLNCNLKTGIENDTSKVALEISSRIQKLLEHSFELDIHNSDFEKIKALTLDLFEGTLQKANNHSFLEPYFKENNQINYNYLKEKIRRNLVLFLDSIVNSIRNHLIIKNNGSLDNIDINSKESKIIILKFINKSLKIINIFGTNIAPDMFSDLLELDKKELSRTQYKFIETTKQLDTFESSENDRINNNENNENAFINSLSFAKGYRVSYRKSNSEYYKEVRDLDKKIKNKEKKGNKLSKMELLDLNNLKNELNILKTEKSNIINEKLSFYIEEEISILYKKIYELFIKTIDLKTNLDRRLLKIKQGFDKIFGYIEYLRGKNIILNDFMGDKEDTMYFNRLTNRLFKSEGTDKGFDNNDSKNIIFLSFLNDFEDKKNSIIKEIGYLREKQIASSFKYNKVTGEDIDVKKVTYSEWSNLDINCTLKIFIENVLKGGLDENISLSGLSLPKGNAKKTFLHVFSKGEKTGNKEVVLKQLSDIESLVKKGVTINELIGEKEGSDKNIGDINNLQFLYELWLFQISVREYGRKLTKSTKISVDYDKGHGLIDIITHEIKKGSNLDGVDYNPHGRLHNMSEENIGDYLDSYFTSFSEGSIDLETYKIGKYTFSDEIDLYCLGEKGESENSKAYIKNGIDVCIKLLEGNVYFDNEEESNYVSILKEKGLIPRDLSKITTSQKGNLVRLITGLQFILPKIDSLEKMLLVASKDSFEVYDIFKETLGNNEYNAKIANGMGPTKQFGRSLIKLVKNYNGDFHKLGDLTRLRISSDSISDLMSKFTEFIDIANNSDSIVNIGVEDWTGHPLSVARKDSGYRDLKAVFTLKSGNVVEFQFHYTAMLEAKATGVKIDKKIEDKLDSEASLLNEDELINFVKEFYTIKGNKKINIEFLEHMSGFNREYIIKLLNSEQISDEGIDSISGDEIYEIRRIISKTSSLHKKITRLERILFDNAWAGLVKEYLSEKTNNKKIDS